MSRRLLRWATAAALASVGAAAGAQDAARSGQRVSVEGAVAHPGTRELPPSARFSDAVLAAAPTPGAYVLGASVLRRDALAAQTRARAGLLYDLQALADDPRSEPAAAALARRLQRWIEGLPATGRVTGRLEPRALEVDLDANRPLAEGDRFVYPSRPATVRIAGAVAQDCAPAHVPLRDARDYLRDCAPDAAADRDWLYAIQPDGHVERLGIAPWNRSAAYPLAPGAWLYVPLSERAVRRVAPDLNRALADFLATQPLPAAEHAP